MDEDLIKITPDRERVKGILKMVALREKRAIANKSEEFATLLLEDYYEIIKELSTALLNLDGYKTLSHKTLFEHLKNSYPALTLSEAELIDELRKTRNKVVYEGFFVKPLYINRNLPYINRIISKLKAQLNKKL